MDQLIFNLRHKLASGDSQQRIHSIRGAGYLLSASAAVAETPTLQLADA